MTYLVLASRWGGQFKSLANSSGADHLCGARMAIDRQFVSRSMWFTNCCKVNLESGIIPQVTGCVGADEAHTIVSGMAVAHWVPSGGRASKMSKVGLDILEPSVPASGGARP